jgi:uncharacterized protein
MSTFRSRQADAGTPASGGRPDDHFSGLRDRSYLLLTTFRRTGVPVATPVWFAEEGGRLYVTTATASGKVKRLRHTSKARVAPCAPWGTARGPSVDAVARLLPPEEHAKAHAALRRKYGWQMRLFERFPRGGEHTYLEVSEAPSDPASEKAASEDTSAA